jgi:hypothetical protein
VVLGSAGVGAAILHRILRIDLAHGLGAGGSAALIFSIDPRLRPWM